MAEGDLRWKYNAGVAIQSEIIVDSNGVIYFGTKTSKIIALNSDGTLKWEFSGSFYHIIGLALSNDESVIFAVDAGNDVYAIYTATGTKKWGYGVNHGDSENPGLSGIVVDSNDNIYVGSWCCAEGLYSIDYVGNFRWDLGGDECHSGHVIGKNNTVIYYQDVDFGLREVQLSDGTINWLHSSIWLGSYGTGISIAGDGTIHYGNSDYFYAVNPDGSEKWNFAVGGNPGTNNAIGSNGNIWFVDINGANSKVYVLTSAGVEVWHYDLSNWVGPGFAGLNLALDSNDIAYVGCYDYKLYALNSDGTLRWTYTAGNKILSGITISSSEDTVYFGCDDGYLYAIEAKECGKIKVGDKVFLLPIGNFFGDIVALKSGEVSTSDKAFLASLDEKKDLKLAFKSCKVKTNDKVICLPIEGMKENIVALR